jgi:hypothetical protein
MPWKVVAFEETPNPNALKCVLDRTIAESARGYHRASEAADDAVASALFGVPGVTTVLLLHDFVTVGKTPEASWASVKKGVRKALERAE